VTPEKVKHISGGSDGDRSGRSNICFCVVLFVMMMQPTLILRSVLLSIIYRLKFNLTFPLPHAHFEASIPVHRTKKKSLPQKTMFIKVLGNLSLSRKCHQSYSYLYFRIIVRRFRANRCIVEQISYYINI